MNASECAKKKGNSATRWKSAKAVEEAHEQPRQATTRIGVALSAVSVVLIVAFLVVLSVDQQHGSLLVLGKWVQQTPFKERKSPPLQATSQADFVKQQRRRRLG
jgi:hypothetical protein